MLKRYLALAVAVFGLATFFLPLVRLTTPLVGTQKISGWDAVKPGAEKRQRDELGLAETLERLQTNLERKSRRQLPLAVRQTEALRFTLPLAYLALVAGAALAGAARWRALAATAGIGLLASLYSILSVHWLSRGVQETVAGTGQKTLLDALRRSVAEQVDIRPEWGLYLLAATLAVLLATSLLPERKR